MTTPDDPNELRQRPIRLANGLWADFDLVAKALGDDRSGLIRDFVRWSTYDETVRPPRRPDTPPAGLRYNALPPEIWVQHETELSEPFKTRPRFIMRIDTGWDVVRTMLLEADLGEGVSYTETSPVQVSTFDRARAERMLALFTDAGLTILS